MPFKKKTLIAQCKNLLLQNLSFMGCFTIFRCQNLGATTDIVFWHPALAVTKSGNSSGKTTTREQPGHQQSHESMRHTFNDRLLCLVTHIPSTPRLRWGLDPLLLPVRRQKGTGGTEIETSWLCVWVRVAVSKVLCYVCHSWAGPSHTALASATTTPPTQTTRPPKRTFHCTNDTIGPRH